MSPDTVIDRILDLSAEAQAKRREIPEDSPEFHKLTGAVLAYGKVLNLLTKLRADYSAQQQSIKTLAAFTYLSAKDFSDRHQQR